MGYTFEALIQKVPDKDATYIAIPFDVEQEFGVKRVKVKATFDGVAYRGSIVNMGLDCHMIGLTKAIRKEIGKEAGDMVVVTIEKDEELREVELPEDLKRKLEQHKQAEDFYNSLSYSGKKKYVQWITSAKKQETKDKRIEEAIAKLEAKIKL